MKEFPVYSRLETTLVRGCGASVVDDQGRTFLDFYGGHAVAALGYGHTGLTEAVAHQADRLVFQSNAVGVDARDRAVAALGSVAPEGLDRVFLVNSGAEANENALRLAFLVAGGAPAGSGRDKVVALRGAFHGRTAAAAAVTEGSAAWIAFPTPPFRVEWVVPGDLAALDRAIDDRTAAFVYEPVQGVAGAVAVPPEFLHAGARLCRERGALSIADEVQCGAGRGGTWWCSGDDAPIPDVMTAAKGLGGGFPVGAVFSRAESVDRLKVGALGTTFGGGPMACAAIEAVVGAVSRPGFLGHVRSISDRLRTEVLGGAVEEVTGKGLLLGLRLDREAGSVRKSLFDRGVLTGDAKDPRVVRLLPPLTVSHDEVDRFITILREVVG